MINVTKTFLPPIDEYKTIVQRAWKYGWLTNRGELVIELEEKLKAYLSVPNIIAMTNGTLPLQIAIKALELKGEIITTPFSYVATTSSIVWEGCTPVFVDIHPEYLTIDEAKIEAAITSKTTAILATHVFGNPCAVEEIDAIANKYNLKVIYDGAHAFGVKYKGKSIFEYGDVSTCSFHATKLFHTGEGGAIFCKKNLFKKIYDCHNFGHNGPGSFSEVGINAKMSELQAALGLAVLPYMTKIIEDRKTLFKKYNVELVNFKRISIRQDTEWNYSYYPILFPSENLLIQCINELISQNINPRRYFYPSLNNLEYLTNTSINQVSESISSRILCLPFYSELANGEIKKIIEVVKKYA